MRAETRYVSTSIRCSMYEYDYCCTSILTQDGHVYYEYTSWYTHQYRYVRPGTRYLVPAPGTRYSITVSSTRLFTNKNAFSTRASLLVALTLKSTAHHVLPPPT